MLHDSCQSYLNMQASTSMPEYLQHVLEAAPNFHVVYRPGQSTDADNSDPPAITVDHTWIKTYHMANNKSQISIKAGNRHTQLSAVSQANTTTSRGRTEALTRKRYR